MKARVAVPLIGTAWLPADLATGPNVYALRATGEPMLGDRIYDGDLVLVDPDRAPAEGQIALCQVTLNNTRGRMIRRIRDGGRVLEASNAMFGPLRIGPEHDLQVMGLVLCSLPPEPDQVEAGL
jgi:SOS-response transcriptional repressor LexA